MMTANEIIHLATPIVAVLDRQMNLAQTKPEFLAINEVAQKTIRALSRFQNDESLRQEVLMRGETLRSQLRQIARESCTHFQDLGGFIAKEEKQ